MQHELCVHTFHVYHILWNCNMDLFSKFIFFAAWHIDYESLIILIDLSARDSYVLYSITISKQTNYPYRLI